jgi:hypothetical protein
MDWKVVLWTALSWIFSGGILYLVYQFGQTTAVEGGVRWKSWRIVALLLWFVVSLAIFGSGYPEEGYGGVPSLRTEFSSEEVSRFLGVFIIIVATYTAGFVDAKMKVKV